MKFVKMQGLGNDYLYFFGAVPFDVKQKAIEWSDRHFGVGSDGLIYIDRALDADFSMRIFNADGSEAKMCGNGIRCVGKYVFDKGYTDKTEITVKTLSGVKTLDMEIEDGAVKNVTVQMGKASVGKTFSTNAVDRQFDFSPVSVGNPHIVTFVSDVEILDIQKYGSKMEKCEFFPDGVNVEFVQKTENGLRMRVWERGSGITLACGTGATATVATAIKRGIVSANEFVSVILDGGTLFIKGDDQLNMTMKGPAEFVCEGDIYD